MNRIAIAVTISSLLALAAATGAQAQTVNFDDLTSPASGVGASKQAYTQYGFTILRIPDPADPASYGNHFHTTAGLGTPGLPNTTAAEFFSDDGAPIRYYLGNYVGTSAGNYAVGTQSPFSLLSFDVLTLDGSFLLTSSTGATLAIDHAGIYDVSGMAGFQNILEFQHTYTGTNDGQMTLDNLTFRPAAPAVPEPGTMALFAGGLISGVGLLRRRRK